MVKQNLGKLDRIFRFVLGLWWLSPLAPHFWSPWANVAVFIIAWVALIESFIGWCGLHDMLGINNRNQ